MRCYNGCPDSALQSLLDERQKCKERLSKIGVRVVYFPMEEKWMGFKDNVAVTGFYNTVHGVEAELNNGRS